jgi:nitrile hydratase
MNAAHDMGGMQAFGPVEIDACDAPGASPFHAEWERRVLAVTLAMGATGQWNIDTSRAARESLPPAQYLGSSYYEIWFEGLKKLLMAKGLASADEIASGRRHRPRALPSAMKFARS